MKPLSRKLAKHYGPDGPAVVELTTGRRCRATLAVGPLREVRCTKGQAHDDYDHVARIRLPRRRRKATYALVTWGRATRGTRRYALGNYPPWERAEDRPRRRR